MKSTLHSIGCPRSQLASLYEFTTMRTDAFYDVDSDYQLLTFLKAISTKTLLDVDAHFAKSQLLTKGANDFTEIDCISAEKFLPIKENIYTRVYEKISDCQFRHYDAALVYGRTQIDFMSMFNTLEGMTDVVITFVKYGAEFEKYVHANLNFFTKVSVLQSFVGRWFIFHRHTPPKHFTMYVVTHKPLPPEHVDKLPAGYKIIHAGRGISPDLGYLGDNTGENISHLNPYINELTALYWMWKNTSHSIIGLSHYRRFFTESSDATFAYEKILTLEAAEKLLQRYDIIVVAHFGDWVQFENIANATDEDMTKFISAVIERNMAKNFPEYIEFFNHVMDTRLFYKCGMFVTRLNIFDAYSRWLFSFIIDTCEEFLRMVDFRNEKLRRLVGYFGEIMLTVWLLKNRLRVKEMLAMHVPNL